MEKSTPFSLLVASIRTLSRAHEISSQDIRSVQPYPVQISLEGLVVAMCIVNLSKGSRCRCSMASHVPGVAVRESEGTWVDSPPSVGWWASPLNEEITRKLFPKQLGIAGIIHARDKWPQIRLRIWHEFREARNFLTSWSPCSQS